MLPVPDISTPLTGAGEPAAITGDRAKRPNAKVDAQSHGEGEKAPGCPHI